MIKKVDETNREIIKLLRDGRRGYSSISQQLGITENTVRSRVNKLIDDGILSVSGLVDIQEYPHLQVAFVGIKARTRDLESKCRQLAALRGAVSCAVVTGRYDLILTLELCEDEGYTLLDFFKYELVKVSELAECETYIIYQSTNFKVPYML